MAKMRAQGNIAGQIGIGPLLGLNMIDTGGGQIPNFYSILVAPSSSGKDTLSCAFAFCFNFFVIPLYRADGCSGTVSLIAVVIHAWHQEKET